MEALNEKKTIKTDVVNGKISFKEKKVNVIDLDALKKTYLEVDIERKPIKGIHHYQLIESVQQMCEQHGLKSYVEEIFAADQKNGLRGNGVTLIQAIEDEKGKDSLEAHCLRRVFTTIRVTNGESDDIDTGIAIAFHQDGIQVGIGPNVKLCHNQCILHPESFITTYGSKNKANSIDHLLSLINDQLTKFNENQERDIKIINKMKAINCSYRDIAELTGHLTFYRVGVDKQLIGEKLYPLSNSQINDFVEEYIKVFKNRKDSGENTDMSLWEIYNIATELYKPENMVTSNIIPQNLAWSEMLINKFININD